MLLLALSPFFKWINFARGGVTGLSGDGKIVLAVTVVAIALYIVAMTKGKWITPVILGVQTWGTLAVFWMGALIWKVGSIFDSSADIKDNPFAAAFSALFATQISPGNGLYVGLIGGITVAGTLGFIAVRRLLVAGDLKPYYATQSVSIVLGILLALFVGPGHSSGGDESDRSSKYGNPKFPFAPAKKEPEVAPQRAREKKEAEWIVAPAPARLGDVAVRVVSAKVARVALIGGPTEERQSENPQLVLTIEVSNGSRSRKIDYRTWAGADVSFERDFATVEDNFGNRYNRITFSIFNQPAGRVVSDSIYPGKSLTDVLMFEPPIEKIQQLDLEMPARNVGTQGHFRIRIPTAMIER
ncbi:MAG: hypothetical protein ACHRXM_19465 [Isosphaerales bacterium]